MAPLPAAEEAFGAVLPQVQRYADLLAGPATDRGLVGPREAPRLWERHLFNCAALAELLPVRGTVVDVGSGAGLPGIVLALLRPDLHIVLVEPQQRRAIFLRECRAELSLTSVEVIRARAEDLAGAVVADVVTARAVAPLDRLLRWCHPLLSRGGRLLAMKGDRVAEEVAASAQEAHRLGVQDVAVVSCRPAWLPDPVTVVVVTAGYASGRAS